MTNHELPDHPDGFDLAVLSPAGTPDERLPIAASRAGAIGVLNLEFAAASADAAPALANMAALGRGRWGALVDGATDMLDTVLAAPGDLGVVLLANGLGDRLPGQLAAIRRRGARAFLVATSMGEARAGEAAGFDAVIAKGHEAGGWVGDDGAYVLLQQCVAELRTPVWIQGGVGLHTAAACLVAGAAGAVLDAQLLLARETPLGEGAMERVRGMDGSETVCAGPAAGARLRVYSQPGLAPVEQLRRLESTPACEDPVAWRAAAGPCVDWRDGVLAVGQDGAFAADLARRFVTVGGILAAVRGAAAEQCRAARRENPLREGAPLARSHGTRHPIVQGPMTRVSDRAEFAAAVAEAGALPLLALALMRGDESSALLEEARDLLGDRPWGVGILGFVPPELRAEQLEAIRAHRPPFALIAGGRPDQARQLEDDGIPTYLHVPSPGLLRLYLNDGARRFVFEGRECGGHVGPRTSFVLWDTMIRTLLEGSSPGADASDYHVLFAGGVHDATSAAMVAAAAAPLAERGARVGVLVGTAYLFTEEAVRHGAITERFQQAAVAGDRTVLLESGPGHATRCLASPFADEFQQERRRLRREGLSGEEQRMRLETLNIGRLRIAAKGAERHPGFGKDPTAPKLVSLDPARQWEQGMFMIGQVASLRDRVCTLSELHDEIVAGCAERLDAVSVPEPAGEVAPPPADVAIVGIGCILPGAPELRTFWANILNKVDAITEVPATRWDWRQYFDPDRAAPDKVYSRWGGFIDDVPFDPVAFGMPPNSLRSIEPFQLLALLAANAALRDAGYADRPFPRERTSVVLGAGGGGADLAVGYTVRSALPMLVGSDASSRLNGALGERLPEWTEDSFPGLLMNVAAGRIANRLDLGGANYTVDAACGSSLAATLLAVRDLQSGTSDMAVIGGVDAIQNPFAYLCFSKTQALSPNGRCRPFDADADGIAISEGFAAVILKRLADAERDGDRVYAVIRGVGAASDGRDRSLTAPRPEGQVRALRRAYAHARISPATVGLVEAHGTGTVAGDRAEVEALSSVYAEAGATRQGCAIGSVKSMIGHTKATAGVAGLIKAALALHHRVLPPTIGVGAPNPKANFPASPFYVNTEARPWVHGIREHPRRAGVSAFGFGGTDFHVVLEEYDGGFLPDRDVALDPWPAELFLWRGETRSELATAIGALADGLERGAQPRLADLAGTLARAVGPAAPARRTLAIVADSLPDLAAKLRTAHELLDGAAERRHAADGVHYAERPMAVDGRVAFLFPGQGSQYVDMARELAVVFPEVRECFDRADRALDGLHEHPLSRYVFPPPVFTREDELSRQAELTETDVAQPALGATDLAYLHLLRSLGVEPQMAAGHSYGEFVALAAAGSLTEEDLLLLSEARGRFIRDGAGEESGAMAAVDAGPDALAEPLGDPELVLANLNAPQQTVVSGSRAAIDRAVEWCAERELRARKLPVACAFHSPFVAPAQRRLAEQLAQTPIAAPRIPVFSNTTAAPHSAEPAEIAATLGEHLVRPVEFAREIDAMHEAGGRLFVEVGPRAVLSGLVGKILGDRPHVAVPVDQPGRPGLVQLLHCLAALAAEGVDVRTQRLFRGRSVEPLNLTTLEPAVPRPERSPAAALVNGGGARPAAQALTPTPPVPMDELIMNAGNGAQANGHRGHDDAAPAPAGDVMDRYHRVMQQFLDTQRTVMLAYLGQPRPSAAAAPPPRDERPALPQPARTPIAPAHVPATNGAGLPDEPAANGVVDIGARLLEIVSDRTGYPPEMLELDADMEADLGIDSIKRVEIAGTMTQSLSVPEGAELDVEELTASRTLRQVIGVLERLVDSSESKEEERLPFDNPPADERIGRFVLQTAGAPAVPEGAGLAGEGVVVIVDDGTGIGEELAERFGARGDAVVRVVSGLGDPEAVSVLLQELSERDRRVKALVHLAALREDRTMDVGALFLLVQGLRADLEAAAGAGGAAVVGATRMGGAFAVDAEAADFDPVQGMVAGFLKTLAQEWPAVRVKAVDVDRSGPAEIAGRLMRELLSADGIVEVGYRGDRRTVLEPLPSPTTSRSANPPLDTGSVVLITGGARGITAEAAVFLAERYRPTLVVVGRTAPSEEGPATAGVSDSRELKRAILGQRRQADLEVTPALVEQEVRRIVREREVRENLARLERCGARVEYLTCDVRDAAAFGALIDRIYETHGRIDGVIHGAGVIEDKLVRDKQPASFERVVATKTGAAHVLAARLRPESLRWLVLFSSVSGRFGNRGQSDYAAASEGLNKLAQQLDRRWDARVVSINWGPWRTAGMVTPEVQRQFAERGVELIPVQLGCRLLEEELRLGRKGEVEVLIGGLRQTEEPAAPLLAVESTVTPRPDGGVEVMRRLDPDQDRYLADHCLDGKPVLPFAAAVELMAETAAAAHPGLEVAQLRDVRLHSGIGIDDGEALVRVVAVPRAATAGTALDVSVETPDDERPRYRAVVELRDRVDDGVAQPGPLTELAGFPMSVEEAYRDYLFHGPLFQGIDEIVGMDERGATALLRPSAPSRCLRDVGSARRWILDPVLVDCALQMQVLWARVHWDVTLLPTQVETFRRIAAPGSDLKLVRHELRIRPTSRSPLCTADHFLYGAGDTLLATLTGMQGAGSRALNRLASVSA